MIKVLYRCWEERINKCFGFFKDFVNLSSMEKQGPQKGHCAPRFAPLFWKNIRKKLLTRRTFRHILVKNKNEIDKGRTE